MNSWLSYTHTSNKFPTLFLAKGMSFQRTNPQFSWFFKTQYKLFFRLLLCSYINKKIFTMFFEWFAIALRLFFFEFAHIICGQYGQYGHLISVGPRPLLLQNGFIPHDPLWPPPLFSSCSSSTWTTSGFRLGSFSYVYFQLTLPST